jgi:recombination protein RecA
MAKKSKTIQFEDDPISNEINKKYGAIVESGTEVLASLENYKTIGISPALDIALGGGLREGSCVVMTGDPKTGKTTTALYFAAKAQKEGKNVIYFNTEGRLTKENFKGIKDLDVSKIKIVQATDKEPLVSAERYLNSLEKYIKGTPDLVAIVDSTSSMVPQDELDGEIRTGVRNALPRLLSMFFKRISGDVARMKAICIFITHNIANTGGSRYAPSKMADCGNMLQYQAGTNMVITHRGKWEVPKDSGNHVGQIANWLIKTSAAGGTPLKTTESWIRYGVGIDECQEVAQIASEFAMIDRSGAWYTITCAVENKEDPTIKSWLIENEVDPEDEEAVTKAFKFQGMERVTNFLETNEDITNFIYQQIREVFL